MGAGGVTEGLKNDYVIVEQPKVRIEQVKVGRGIPIYYAHMYIRSIVHYINIYSRIVIQLNMYVKIITSSGFKSTILTDFVQG